MVNVTNKLEARVGNAPTFFRFAGGCISLSATEPCFRVGLEPTPSEIRNAITTPPKTKLEPVKGIEPPSQLYESRIIPLYDTGIKLEPALGTAPSSHHYKWRPSLYMLHRHHTYNYTRN